MRERREGRESGCCVSPGAVQRTGWAGELVDSCDDGWRAGGVLLVWLIYSIPRVGYSLWQHIYSSCPLTVTTLDMRRTPRVAPRRKGHRGAEAPAPGLRVRAGSRKGRHQRHQTGGGKLRGYPDSSAACRRPYPLFTDQAKQDMVMNRMKLLQDMEMRLASNDWKA